MGRPSDGHDGHLRKIAVEMADSTNLPTLLRTWRERALLTQEQLAERTGLGVRTIRRLESEDGRRPHSGSLRLLADALGLSSAEREQLATARAGPAASAAEAVTPATTEPAASEQVAPAGGHTARVPRQLPPDVAGFAGRAGPLATMNRLLEEDRTATTVVISTVAGTAGVGKTALALHWAHRAAARFPDGQLYVNLRGFDPTGSPVTPGEAIRGFLDAFAVAPERIPTGLDAQVALYRSMLAGRRILVVLDNACDTEQVRPLLPGTAGCMALVTSRTQLTSLVATQGAHPLTLDLLSATEAHTLLMNRIGEDRVHREGTATNKIIARCAGLPLALALVAARAAIRPTFDLDTLAAELDETRPGLDALAGHDPSTDMRDVFSWSYQRLTDGAAALFRVLGNHPGPDVTAPVAASMAAIPLPRIRPLLAELTRAHLLAEDRPGRYSAHDLLRAYAGELTRGRDADADRRSTVHRMLDHYLHTAHVAENLLSPYRHQIVVDPCAAGVVPELPTDHHEALAWLTAEHTVLPGLIDTAVTLGFDAHTWRLAWSMSTFLDRRCHWPEQIRVQRIGLDAAVRCDDRQGQAHLHRILARAYTRLRRFAEAHRHYQQALNLFEAIGDARGKADIHGNLSWLYEEEDRYDDALEHSQIALAIYQTSGDRHGIGRALNSVGWVNALLGHYDQALALCRQAIPLLQESAEHLGEAGTWDSLGYIHHQLGDYQQAQDCLQNAIRLYRSAGARHNVAIVLHHLGDNCHALGDDHGAAAAWSEALATFEMNGHSAAEQVRRKMHGLRTT